jgi:hypothetical protein
MKTKMCAVAAMAALAWALSGLQARADSISVSSATGVKDTIQANGTWQANSVTKITMQVSTDGKTWTDAGLADISFGGGKLTWSGITTGSLAKGTYQFRATLTNNNAGSPFISNVVAVNVPGPQNCESADDDDDEPASQP